MNRFFNKCGDFFAKPFFSDYRTLLGLWLLLPVVAAVAKLHSCNNFLMYKNVFWHVWNETSLFAEYPAEYFDVNHYGPLFGVLIAPFAVTPLFVGLLTWLIALSMFLYVAIRRSQVTRYQQLFILWFCVHELLTALFMMQFNVAIAAVILFSYYCIEKEKDFWAAFFIMLGTFVKIYGIVGLAFFFFSKHKGKFIGSLIFWAVVMFVTPMAISSPEYVVGQYQEWYTCLLEKNNENWESIAQNIAVGNGSAVVGSNDSWRLTRDDLQRFVAHRARAVAVFVALSAFLAISPCGFPPDFACVGTDVRHSVLHRQRIERLYHALYRHCRLVHCSPVGAHKVGCGSVGFRFHSEQYVA